MERIKFLISLLFMISPLIFVECDNVHAIFSFGDSILDAGNNHYIINCTAQADFSPYGSSFFHHPTGRFTNGRIVPDFISQFLGIPFQKPFLEVEMEIGNGTLKDYPSNGINFASAGSGIFSATDKDMKVTPLQVQVQQFQTLVEQNHIDKQLIQQAFYFFASGSNDVVSYFDPSLKQYLTPEAYVQAMLKQVQTLIHQIYKIGGRRIGLCSLGPVGCVPARSQFPGVPIDKCFEPINKIVESFNTGLENIVKSIPSMYPGAIGVYGAVYDTIQSFRANPNKYGFKNVTNACCGSGILGGEGQCGRKGYTLCSDPNTYLFWDNFHPSEYTYELISKTLWEGGRSQIRPINLKELANLTLA